MIFNHIVLYIINICAQEKSNQERRIFKILRLI